MICGKDHLILSNNENQPEETDLLLDGIRMTILSLYLLRRDDIVDVM